MAVQLAGGDAGTDRRGRAVERPAHNQADGAEILEIAASADGHGFIQGLF
jgi:hypothetical protein